MNGLAWIFACSVGIAVQAWLETKRDISLRKKMDRLLGRNAGDEQPGWTSRIRIKMQAQRTARAAIRTLPDFLELTAMGLSAGLVLESAWAQAVRGLRPGPVKKELERCLEWVRRGESRVLALREAGRRLVDPRAAMIMALVTQSLERGNDVGPVLLDQARALRSAALVELERRSQTAPLRLLFPVLFFLLPAVFLVLLGPVFVRGRLGLPLF